MSRLSPVPLYSLQKLLSVRTDGYDPSLVPTPSFSNAEEPRRMTFGSMMASISGLTGLGASTPATDYSTIPAQISTIAQGGVDGNAYFALYTTNNYLIFRYVGESGVPMVRMMPWYKDPNMKIVGMAFNLSAQWLVCVTMDLSVVILSIYFMIVRENPSPPINIIQSTRYTREKKANFSDVKCWRSGSGAEYAVITTVPGNVRLVNLTSGDYFKVKAKTSLGKFHVVTEPGRSPRTWLFIESPGYGFYRLLIGHYLDSGKFEDLTTLATSQKPEFQFQTLNVSKQVKLSVQQTQRGPMIITFDPEIKQVHIHDIHLRLLYKYNVNTPNEVKSVHVSEKLLFALTAPAGEPNAPPNKLIVMSRILSEEKRQPVAPYQEFTLPAFENVKSSFLPNFNYVSTAVFDPIGSASDSAKSIVMSPASPGPSTKAARLRPKSIRAYTQVSRESLLVALTNGGSTNGKREAASSKDETSSSDAPATDKDIFSYARVKSGGVPSSPTKDTGNTETTLYFDEREGQEYDDDFADMTKVESAFIWTDDALYELKPVVSPEQLFFKFIERADKKNGEALGLTFALDVHRLYELAADEYFKKGKLGDAQAYYHLSNVSTPKLIRQWLSIGRMDEPISTLRVLLASGKVGEARRPRVANELIRCHVQRLLSPSKQANVKRLLNVNERCHDEELETFLKNNPDFSEKEMRRLFQLFGLLRFDLIVAQARRHLKQALESLTLDRGLAYLSMEHLRFISENNALESGTLKVSDANTLLSHFPSNTQLLHHLSAVSNIPNSMPRIQDLLNELDDDALAQICRFFDPQGPFVGPMLTTSQESDSQQQQNHDGDHSHYHNQLVQTQHQRSASNTGGRNERRSGTFNESRLFVSQCVELFLTALIRLNRGKHTLPQAWTASAPSPSVILTLQRETASDSIERSIDLAAPATSITTTGLTSSSGSESTASVNYPTSPAPSLQRSTTPLKTSNSGNNDQRGLKMRKAVAVSCGFHHTALLTDNGQVFTWGAGSKGQLGHANVSDSLWVPKLVASLSSYVLNDKVIKVTCGGHHTLALTQNGQLFTFGQNARGQLGLGDRKDRFEPRQVVLGDDLRHSMGNIVDFSAGFWHSVLVTEKGVWTAGANTSGNQMGALQAEDSDQLLFTRLSNMPTSESYIMVRCGFAHSALLTKRGRVYTFGSNEHGQLGLGHKNPCDTPQLVRGILEDKHIVDIACGSFTSFAVSDISSVYAWGLGTKNRLGLLPPNERRATSPLSRNSDGGRSSLESSSSDVDEYIELSPVRIDALQGQEIVRVFSGPSHTFAVNNSGKSYVWGDCNTTMRSKTGDSRLPTLLTPWTDLPAALYGCGDDFSVCVMENGLVYTFGKGMCGQLGHNDENDQFSAKQAFLNTSLMVEDMSSSHTQTSPSSSSEFPHTQGLGLSQDFNSPGTIQKRAKQHGKHQSKTQAINTTLPPLPSVEEHPLDGALTSSTLLNAPSAVSTYSSPAILEQSLQQLAKKYRPAVILQQCRIVDNLAAAAIILEQSNAWGASIDCKVRLLKQELPKLQSVQEQTRLLTELLKDLAQPGIPLPARQQGLNQVLTLWNQVGGSIETLETMLSGSTLVSALAGLLAEEKANGHSPSSSRSVFSSMRFTSKFLLQVAKCGLEEQRKASEKKMQNSSFSHTLPAAKDPTWAERRANLEKDIKLRTKIQISQPALEDYIQHTGANKPGWAGDVVFTCGHILSELRFTQSTLQLFRDKMAKFPVQLPLTVKLLLTDWQRTVFNAACPPCVYNHLRDKHAPSLERWNPQ